MENSIHKEKEHHQLTEEMRLKKWQDGKRKKRKDICSSNCKLYYWLNLWI
jgi:hypothetical protein